MGVMAEIAALRAARVPCVDQACKVRGLAPPDRRFCHLGQAPDSCRVDDNGLRGRRVDQFDLDVRYCTVRTGPKPRLIPAFRLQSILAKRGEHEKILEGICNASPFEGHCAICLFVRAPRRRQPRPPKPSESPVRSGMISESEMRRAAARQIRARLAVRTVSRKQCALQLMTCWTIV